MSARRILRLAAFIVVALFLSPHSLVADEPQPLDGTKPLLAQGDLATSMVAGIDRFLMRELEAAPARRESYWNRDFSSTSSYTRSVEPNREHLRRMIGVVDARIPVALEVIESATPRNDGIAQVASYPGGGAFAVRWSVLDGVDAEGLLLLPKGEPVADVIALPDCDWTPEMIAGPAPGAASCFARQLADAGCRVLVPVLIDRRDTWSGIPGIRMTNQPHREFIYRAAFEMGRHIIGYEVQKTLAAVDWFTSGGLKRPIGVIGYGEGGLIAFYSAAVDPRINAACVSGYFGPRQSLWREPIYRNVFGLLEEFGDAEIASLITPRAMVVEAARAPVVTGPPGPRAHRTGAAPGAIPTVSIDDARGEFVREYDLVERLQSRVPFHFYFSEGEPFTTTVLQTFFDLTLECGGSTPLSRRRLDGADSLKNRSPASEKESGVEPPHSKAEASAAHADARMKRQFHQLLEHTQRLMRDSEFRRAEFWAKADFSTASKFIESAKKYRDMLWDDVIGRFPPASLPANPRTRLVYDEPEFRGYEVMLDVWPDVFAYGILLVPKDIKPGERRPVVVCQHGLEGRPQNVADPKIDNPSYHQYACKLAREGFITYAPQNPYIGGDAFRVLQRKANPLGKSLFSVIVRQHEVTLDWLASLPFVDPDRIAFYGLSYGGKTAMRVPALLDRYCLSICSADYNEWIWKNVSARHKYSYLLTGEYEMPEFNLGNTFNYAELSWLIFPRPFMVERGHDDGVAPDEWVAYEYARTRRHYDLLGLGDRTTIEFFNGPHTINGVGTFEFLRKHLRWERP